MRDLNRIVFFETPMKGNVKKAQIFEIFLKVKSKN